MIDRQTARGMIHALEVFRGREPEEYSFLVEPLTDFILSTPKERYPLGEVNKLVKAILTGKPEIVAIDIEPSVTTQFLAEQIKPWVEDIRQKLFHSKSAPFSCIEDAKTWLAEVDKKDNEWKKRMDEWYKEVDAWHKRADEWERRSNEYHDYWQAILEEYPHITGGIEKWSLMKKQGIEVKFPPEAGWQKLNELQLAMQSLEIGEVGDSPEKDEQVKTYYALLDDILEVCKKTGFTYKSAEMHILADTSPVLPPFTFGIVRETHSLPSGTSLQNRFASVTIRGDLTFEDLRSLYRSIRRELGIKHSKRLTKKHLQLYEMVTKRGSIPNGAGTVAFWTSVMKDWNVLHRQDKYKTWKGVKLAYERIIDQVERRMTKEGGYNER